MDTRRVCILFLSPFFPYQRRPLWLDRVRHMLPALRDLAGRLREDNIQFLLGGPYLRRLEELDKLTDPEVLRYYLAEEDAWHKWRNILEDMPTPSYLSRLIKNWMDDAGIDFLLLPVVRETTSTLDRWMYYFDLESLSGRVVFVNFKDERLGFVLKRGFKSVSFPFEYQKLVQLLKSPPDKFWSPAPAPMMLPASYYPPPAAHSPPLTWRLKERLSIKKRSQPPPRGRGAGMALPGKEILPAQTEVFLGAATPRAVVPGSEFVARFAAYVEDFREQVSTIFTKEAPKSEVLLDLASCRWKVGTKVRVRLSARDLTVKTGPQRFTWNGEYETLRFDVEVPADCQAPQAILKFDVVIDGVVIATLRPEIEITKAPEAGRAADLRTTETRSPRTAFASYATRDRRSVFGRVRSLQIHTGIDVFFDCLSIRPGEQWKPEIVKQIRDSEIFWLFWSRRAKKSSWVDWEWRQALAAKTLLGIQPHPLEPSDLAPPPPELQDLQFGTAYEYYLTTLQDSWLRYKLHRIKETVSRLFRN